MTDFRRARTRRSVSRAQLLGNDSDPDGFAPVIDTVDAVSAESGAIADLGSGDYQYTPPANFTGVDTFTYTIVDGAGATDVATVSVTVGDVNDPPEVTDPGDQQDDEGAIVSLQIVAADMDGDALTYSAAGLPPDLSIDPDTGLISGTITQTSAGVYPVTVTVTDGATPVSVNFDWTVSLVNLPPVLADPGDQTNVEGELVSLPLLVSNDDEDVLAFSATGLPPGLSIDPDTGEISGTIADGAEGSSPYSVTVTVAEVGTADLFEDEVAFTWDVKNFWQVFLPLVVNNP
jgi:hypothetical protein